MTEFPRINHFQLRYDSEETAIGETVTWVQLLLDAIGSRTKLAEAIKPDELTHDHHGKHFLETDYIGRGISQEGMCFLRKVQGRDTVSCGSLGCNGL